MAPAEVLARLQQRNAGRREGRAAANQRAAARLA
jgi:hypothetical protein